MLKIPEAALRFKPAGAASAAPDDLSPEDRREAARARLVALIKSMTERLNLNDDQREQVKSIVVESAMAARQLGDDEQAKAAIDQIRAQARQRIAQVLDDEQKQLYRVMQAERDSGSLRRGQVWLLNQDGEPQAVGVTVGLSDDTAAELLRGEIDEGARLVVGLAASARRS